MKTALLIAVGAAALTLAACNKPAEETADTSTSVVPAEATPSDGAMAPADGAMASGSAASDAAPGGPMSARAPSTGNAGSGRETMRPAGSGAMSGQPMASTVPNAQETIAATKPTLSPGGASSGPTAPPPAN